MGNTFGHLFRIATWGESHGGGVGVVIDGCPPRLELSEADIQPDLDRRRPGQSKIVTPRKEADRVQILSGVFEGKTLGTPISMWVKNEDARSEAYSEMASKFRPSHADYTYQAKYGFRNWQGGGRSSARETIGRVAAGAVARKVLKQDFGVEVLAYVSQVKDLPASVDPNTVAAGQIESNIVRCPDPETAEKMIGLIEEVKADDDSVGGVVRGVIRGLPAGLGEPVFDKLPADLAKAMMSINATKGFEFGSGFDGVTMRGSRHNDEFRVDAKGNVRTKTNYAGGTLGGISSGETVYFRVAIKPVSTIAKEQTTVTTDKKFVKLEAKGRHDPCVLPRAIPIVDAMAALVIMDHYLRHKAQNL